MKPIVESWVSSAEGLGFCTHQAIIRASDCQLTVCSSPRVCANYESAVQVRSGAFSLALDPATALALGQQLIAAAVHYDDLVAAMPAAEANT
jgi:hypothetical protein